jgi:hypothetical protein
MQHLSVKLCTGSLEVHVVPKKIVDLSFNLFYANLQVQLA